MLQLLTWFYGKVTRTERYRVSIEWNPNCWTHNIFRVFELLFGRKYGIRAEISLRAWKNQYGQKTIYAAHSFEGACALTEQAIRQILKFKVLIPVRIWIPVLRTPQGMPVFASPYLFAIAFDAKGRNSGILTSSVTIAGFVTASGSDLKMLGSVILNNTIATPTVTLTYNTIAASLLVNSQESIHIFDLPAPATGSHDVVATSSETNDIYVDVATYSGVDQTLITGSAIASCTTATCGGGGTNTSISLTVTPIAANDWLFGSAQAVLGTNVTSGTNFVPFTASPFTGGDSNGIASSATQTFVTTPASFWIAATVSFAPSAAAVVTGRNTLLNLLGVGT